MSYPPVFATVRAWPAVLTLLGSTTTRVWPFGQGPQAPAKPYVVWQVVAGLPENYLGDRPDIDQYTIQFDVYADTAASARLVGDAIRDAIELQCHIVSWRGESRDTDTQLYRISFDADWLVKR